MIGWLEGICDRARADCRRGERAHYSTMSGTARMAYMNAWAREHARMQALGKLPQLELVMQYETPPVAENACT